METLSKRLMDTFQNIQYNSYTPLEIKQLSEKWAEETKKIAIEFGMFLRKEIEKDNYFPETFEKLFNKFIEEYYV